MYSVLLRSSPADPGLVDVQDLDPQGTPHGAVRRAARWPAVAGAPATGSAAAGPRQPAGSGRTPTSGTRGALGGCPPRAGARPTPVPGDPSALDPHGDDGLRAGSHDAWDEMHPVPTAPSRARAPRRALRPRRAARRLPPDPVGELRRQLEAVATSSGAGGCACCSRPSPPGRSSPRR
ncbi:hypothetical protein NKG05_25540 [Oerskovia sp. M15]